MQSLKQRESSAFSATVCRIVKNNTAGCGSLCGVITPSFRLQENDTTPDLGCMNMHKPVHLSPHFFGIFLSQRGAIIHPQHPGMGWVLFEKSIWPAFKFGSCVWKYIHWKCTRGDKPFCSFWFLHRHHLILGSCKYLWLWVGKEIALVLLVSIL